MADYNSGLPIRSQADGADERVQVKIVDGSTPTQKASVDSAGNLSVNLGKVVGTVADVNNGATSAGTLRVTISNDSTGQVKLATGSNTIGSLAANQSVNVSQVSGTTTSVNNGTTDAGTQRVTLSSDSTGQVKLATGANTIGQLTANQSVNTAQVAGTNTSVNTGTADAGTQRVVIASNQPSIPVSFQAAGTVVTDYNTAAAVASAGTSTHIYTVTTGKTLTFAKCYATASGKLKITVQVDLGAGLVTKFVGFNSTANPDIVFDLGDFGISVASTKTVAIIRQNNDNQAQDVYSTIIGTEQ